MTTLRILLDSHVFAWFVIGDRKQAIVAQMAEVIERLQMRPLSISLEPGRFAGALVGRHKDPFDRLLAAQAQIEGLILITVDPAFASLGTPTLW